MDREREACAPTTRSPKRIFVRFSLHSTHGRVLITLGIHRKSRIFLRDFAISKRTLWRAFRPLHPSPSALCIALEIPVQSRPFPFDARDPTGRLTEHVTESYPTPSFCLGPVLVKVRDRAMLGRFASGKGAKTRGFHAQATRANGCGQSARSDATKERKESA